MRRAIGIVTVAASCVRAAAQFTWCGSIPDGQWLRVAAVADGGTAIVGTGNFPNAIGGTIGQAYRWTPATGIVQLGNLPSSNAYSDGYAISADGSIVVGDSFASPTQATRWLPPGGPVALPLAPGCTGGGAKAISADGATMIGWCIGPAIAHAARWTAAGAEDLGAPPFGTYATPQSASRDASVFVGYAYTSLAMDDVAFMRDADGWHNLGVLPGDTQSRAGAISGDGSVVLGYSRGVSPFATHAFRWTHGAGLEPLPPLPGAVGMTPFAASGDGSVIIGAQYIFSNPSPDGFIWTRAGGMQSVRAVLQSYGIDLSGTIAVVAQAITPDGRTLAGTAGGPNQYRAWVATLPSGFGCYANCDSSTAAPATNVNDFICFLNRFAAADPYANCDGSTAPPVLNVNDFICFLNRFAAGCP